MRSYSPFPFMRLINSVTEIVCHCYFDVLCVSLQCPVLMASTIWSIYNKVIFSQKLLWNTSHGWPMKINKYDLLWVQNLMCFLYIFHCKDLASITLYWTILWQNSKCTLSQNIWTNIWSVILPGFNLDLNQWNYMIFPTCVPFFCLNDLVATKMCVSCLPSNKVGDRCLLSHSEAVVGVIWGDRLGIWGWGWLVWIIGFLGRGVGVTSLDYWFLC